MSRLLYIAVRGPNETGVVPASNMRRIYSSDTAAWLWLERRNDPNRNWEGERTVYEVDLDEAVRIGQDAALTVQARYEHAERRATRWLALREHLEPLVAGGAKPSGSDTWTLRGVDLAKLKRTFSGWRRVRLYSRGPDGKEEDALRAFADNALRDVLADLLDRIDDADLVGAEAPP